VRPMIRRGLSLGPLDWPTPEVRRPQTRFAEHRGSHPDPCAVRRNTTGSITGPRWELVKSSHCAGSKVDDIECGGRTGVSGVRTKAYDVQGSARLRRDELSRSGPGTATVCARLQRQPQDPKRVGSWHISMSLETVSSERNQPRQVALLVRQPDGSAVNRGPISAGRCSEQTIEIAWRCARQRL